MASNAAKEALLPGSSNPCDFRKRNLLKRSKDQNSGSPSSADNSTQFERGNKAPPEIPESIFDQQLHFKRVIVIFLSYISIGSLCFFLVRNQMKGKKTNGVLDSIYFCVVTMTTIGYGDLVPDTMLAKLLACVFVFSGMALVGYVLSKLADYILEREGNLFYKAINASDIFGSTDIAVENNKSKYKFITTLTILLFLIVVGTLFLHKVEGLDFFDAFYCVCTTMTTLGYGDKSFSTEGGRLFAIFWMLTSTICLAQLFVYFAEFWSEGKRKLLVDWVLDRKFTAADLEAADLDNDKVVSVAEFVVYKLKEMGKISKEDVTMAMEHFRYHDIDHSGTLTASDLA
ncbi:Two-pore potassium channel 1 [Heracleum sosnowskyi]|uniref:Two-pore potassium channel 1 n=1 Tax=Heracleum sosnowskyi TaxID=360622 RepID=A0AAD8J472_9APIA|nr:Two-pore potassium channel 1 [Heracleum sosnowskyi]